MLDGNKKRFLVDFELALKFIFIRPIRKVSLSKQNQMHGNVKRGEVMQINSFHHAPSYVQGGIPSLAALPHESARKPLTEDLQPAGFDDLSSSQVEDLEKAIEMAKERLKDTRLNIRLSSGDGKDSFQIEVFNPETNEIIRRFPPDEIIRLSASIKKMNGFVVDKAL
jgi:uncharacterized FlaG/YvyC family protein